MSAAVLVAEDDPAFGLLLTSRLEEVDGVGEVVHAVDGPEAVQLGLQRDLDIAVFDVGLPRLGGIEAALVIGDLRPSVEIVLQTADRRLHAERAHELGLRLFDKRELEQLVDWVEWRVSRRGRRESEAAGAGRSARAS